MPTADTFGAQQTHVDGWMLDVDKASDKRKCYRFPYSLKQSIDIQFLKIFKIPTIAQRKLL